MPTARTCLVSFTDVAIEAQLVIGNCGKTTDAKKILRGSLKEAQTLGLYVRCLQARSAIAVIEGRERQNPEGREALLAVAHDARANGFVRLARKAEQAEKALGAADRQDDVDESARR